MSIKIFVKIPSFDNEWCIMSSAMMLLKRSTDVLVISSLNDTSHCMNSVLPTLKISIILQDKVMNKMRI